MNSVRQLQSAAVTSSIDHSNGVSQSNLPSPAMIKFPVLRPSRNLSAQYYKGKTCQKL
jgi:hypothetical protein